jgi:hypothetical protein
MPFQERRREDARIGSGFDCGCGWRWLIPRALAAPAGNSFIADRATFRCVVVSTHAYPQLPHDGSIPGIGTGGGGARGWSPNFADVSQTKSGEERTRGVAQSHRPGRTSRRNQPEQLGWYCPQSKLESLLLTTARQREVDARYDTELVSFAQDERGVTALLRDRATGKTSDVRADYLLAADGAHSKIREALGIPTQGLGELPESQMFVYFRADWGELIQDYEADAILTVNESGRGMFLITDQDRGMLYHPSHAGRVSARLHCRALSGVDSRGAGNA